MGSLDLLRLRPFHLAFIVNTRSRIFCFGVSMSMKILFVGVSMIMAPAKVLFRARRLAVRAISKLYTSIAAGRICGTRSKQKDEFEILHFDLDNPSKTLLTRANDIIAVFHFV